MIYFRYGMFLDSTEAHELTFKGVADEKQNY